MKLFYTLLTIALAVTANAQISSDSIRELFKKKIILKSYPASTGIQFGNDTLIVAGYFEHPSDTSRIDLRAQNTIYKSVDRGQSWRPVIFGGDAWIYTMEHHQDGKIWMGGSDSLMHYSADYGETWQKKPRPFQPADRIISIFMKDSLTGLAGGYFNGLSITTDNWKTATQLPTPIDQKKFLSSKDRIRRMITNLLLTDSLIFINHHNHVFYSRLSPIDWKKFDFPVVDFSYDREAKQILLYSPGKTFVVDEQLQLIKIEKEKQIDELAVDNNYIDLHEFISKKIKLVKLVSVKHTAKRVPFDTTSYIKRDSIVHKAEFKMNKGNYTYKNKSFTLSDLQNLLKNSNINSKLSDLSGLLHFTSSDHKSFSAYLKQQKKEFDESKPAGGDSTDKISPDNDLFTKTDLVLKNLNSQQINSTFNRIYRSDDWEGIDIRLEITNSDNEIIILSAKDAIIYSLPWTVTYKGKSIKSYSPEITAFVMSILPANFNNVEMFNADKLIYYIIEQEIIDQIQYIKPKI